MSESKKTKNNKPRWQEQIEELRKEKPVRADIILSETQDCLVYKASENGKAIQAKSLVWEGIFYVKYDRKASAKLVTEYNMVEPGDIIRVEKQVLSVDTSYSGSVFFECDYIFKGIKESAKKRFIKDHLKKEVKVEDFESAVEEMRRFRRAIEKFEYNNDVKIIGQY